LPRHAGTEDDVPVDKPRLGKVGFDADGLVVYIVVICRVTGDHLERIEREAVPAMVVDCLAGGEDEEEHRLADREARDGLGEHGSKRVEEEALDGMVVQRAVSIGHVQPVMDRMEVFVKEPVKVHRAVEEVLPCVERHPNGFFWG